jgi:hypothetical protein
MSDEEKTQEQIEDEAYKESASAVEGKEPDDDPEKPPEEVEAKETDKEGAEASDEEPEKDEEKEPDYKAEAEELKKKLEKTEQERDANKRFADDQAKKRAEDEKKRLEEKEEEPETPPEEVAAFLEEYPEAEKAIDFMTRKGIKAGVDAYNKKLREACGGKDPVEFIGEMIEYKDQSTFERTVMIGYYDESGKHVPGHPDIVTITHDPEFHKYTEGKLKDDPSLGPKLDDPIYTIKFVSEYKESELEQAAEKDKKKQKEQKEEIEEQASGADKDVTKKPAKKEADPYDEEAAYQEGVKAVEQL